MQKKIKLFFTMITFCFSLAVLCFGVFAAVKIDYTIGGTLSYVAEDVYVEIEARVYRYKSLSLLDGGEAYEMMDDIKTMSFENLESTYKEDLEVIKSYSKYSSLTQDSLNAHNDLDLTYGAYDKDNQMSYAFFIVINVKNLSSQPIYATAIDIQNPPKSWFTDTSGWSSIEQTDNTTSTNATNVVFCFGLNKLTESIEEGTQINYSIECGLNKTQKLDSGKDVLTYTENGDGTLTVTGVSEEFTGDTLVIPNTHNGKNVTAIECCYYGTENLEGETVPQSLVIGDYVEVIDEGEKEFFGDSETLTHIVFSDTENLTTIGSCALYNNHFTSINIPKQLDHFVSYFSNDAVSVLYIPEKYNNDWENMFCTGLDFVRVAEENTFFTSKDSQGNECNAIFSNDMQTIYLASNNATIQNGVITIGAYAFYGLKMQNITIPDGVQTIKECAFSYCSNLKSISIPNSVTTIEGYVFTDCISLQSITLPNSLTVIARGLFNFSGLQNISIPESVETIESNAFSNCEYLQDVLIPSSVTELEGYVFSNCQNLSNVTFEHVSGTIKIGSGCFSTSALVRINGYWSCLTTTYTEELTNANFLNNKTWTITQTKPDDGDMFEDLPSYYCLRDENIIFTQNQDRMGLCWDFAGIKSIETTIGKYFNEYYDFSEAWIALCRKMNSNRYVMGDGGNASDVYNAIQKYGLVLESDCPFEMVYNFDDSNYEEYFNYYKQFASFEYVDILKYIPLTTNDYIGSYQSNSNIEKFRTIKEYIMENGSLYISFKASGAKSITTSAGNKISTYRNTTSGSNHAVSLIGWDDDITFEVDGGQTSGAWIILNSWANGSSDGFYYIMYDDMSISSLAGYIVDESKVDNMVTLNTSNSSIKNLYSNYAQYNYQEPEITNGKQGNVFYMGDEIDISYQNPYSSDRVEVEIYDGDKLTNLFNVNVTNTTINIADSLAEDDGCFKVLIKYDSDQDGEVDKVHTKQIYVLSGVVLDGVSISGGQPTTYSTQSIDVENIYLPISMTSSSFSVNMNIGSYSQISKVESSYNGAIKSISLSKSASEDKYSSGSISIVYTRSTFGNDNTPYGTEFVVQVIFTTLRGYTKTINLHLINNDSSNDDDIVYINYLTHINNVTSCPKIMYYDGSDLELTSINGISWYYDADSTQIIIDNTAEATKTVLVSARNNYCDSGKKYRYLTVYLKYVA